MKLVILLLPLALSCAEKKSFSGSNAGATDTEKNPVSEVPAPVSPTAQPGPGIANCVEGDRVIPVFSGAVKECLDSGRTWHFESKACVAMPQAAFTCDWATLQGKLTSLNLLTETLKNDAAAGAKLISCGQSADGNRIAVQWIKPASAVSCEKIQEGFGITTGCYTHYVDRSPPPPATTDDERRVRVNECLQNL